MTQDKLITVRPYRLADIETIVSHMQDYHATTRLRKYPFDRERVVLTLRDGLRSQVYFAAVAVDANQTIVGGIAGEVEEFIFGGRFAQDHVFYILQEHRSIVTATMLLKAWEDWARSKNALQVRIGTASGYQPVRFREFAHAMGYSDFASMYSKELNGG